MKRKRMYLIGLVLAIAVVFTGSQGYAYPVKIDDLITLKDSYGTTGGGEFIVTGPGYSFQTFCVELGESLAFNLQFKVVGISTSAFYGGVGPGGDPLGFGTAYLFSSFDAGSLSGYDYTPGLGRIASANNLQNAIWKLEGEGGPGNVYYQGLAAGSGWTDLGNVRVLNLEWAVNSGVHKIGDRAQDILVTVPEPGTLLLLGAGLLGLGFLVRRRFN